MESFAFVVAGVVVIWLVVRSRPGARAAREADKAERQRMNEIRSRFENPAYLWNEGRGLERRGEWSRAIMSFAQYLNAEAQMAHAGAPSWYSIKQVIEQIGEVLPQARTLQGSAALEDAVSSARSDAISLAVLARSQGEESAAVKFEQYAGTW